MIFYVLIAAAILALLIAGALRVWQVAFRRGAATVKPPPVMVPVPESDLLAAARAQVEVRDARISFLELTNPVVVPVGVAHIDIDSQTMEWNQ